MGGYAADCRDLLGAGDALPAAHADAMLSAVCRQPKLHHERVPGAGQRAGCARARGSSQGAGSDCGHSAPARSSRSVLAGAGIDLRSAFLPDCLSIERRPSHLDLPVCPNASLHSWRVRAAGCVCIHAIQPRGDSHEIQAVCRYRSSVVVAVRRCSHGRLLQARRKLLLRSMLRFKLLPARCVLLPG